MYVDLTTAKEFTIDVLLCMPALMNRSIEKAVSDELSEHLRHATMKGNFES